MSRNGSDKEYFFSLSIKFSRQQLEKALNVKMTDEIGLRNKDTIKSKLKYRTYSLNWAKIDSLN